MIAYYSLMDLEGAIVEFVDSGALRLGYVRRREQRKIQVVDQRGRQSSVPTSRVIVVHETIPEEEFRAAATRIEERVEACKADIDVSLLWESVHALQRAYSLTELTEVYFGQVLPENESATYRVLDQGSLFFKRSGSSFEPRSERQVSAERLRITREQENERYRGEVTRLLRRAVEENAGVETMTSETLWPQVLDRLERWLRQNDRDEVGYALERIVGEAGAREVAYDLLIKFGQIEASEDRFILVRGLPTVFPKDVVDAARALEAETDPGGRTICSDLRTLSIDDEYTVEIDDALTVVEDGDQTVVGIHIADVASFVNKGDALDREAHRRSSTLYLPNISVTMFPPRLATDLASLIQGSPRPAFSVEARFSSDGTILDSRFFRSIVTVTDRMNYTAADDQISQGDPALTRLLGIAHALQSKRIEQGAQTHHRPDIKVHVSDGEIRVERLEANTPARLIVSEMMILANQLAASHAANAGIPIIFRTQEAPSTPRPDTGDLPEVLQFERLRKNFKRSRLSLHPSPHAGLGLSSYAQMSSPIRRYADLVTQRQFAAALEDRPLPYDREELLEVMTSCEAHEVEIRRLEQTSTTWWILTYLGRERLGVPLEAVVVDNKGTVELSEVLVRARLKGHDGLNPGDSVTVRIESVDPERGGILLSES